MSTYNSESRKPNMSSNDRNSSKMFFRKNKGCSFCTASSTSIDYKNPDLLKGFISKGGRMLPSRVTNVCAKHQRSLKKAIKHSRVIALLPFVFTGR